jgi:hypothetical protein
VSLCQATGCTARTVKNRIMCSPHWFMAAPLTRARWRAAMRRVGTVAELVTSREALEATADLIDEVAVAEGKPIGSVWRERLGALNAGEVRS